MSATVLDWPSPSPQKEGKPQHWGRRLLSNIAEQIREDRQRWVLWIPVLIGLGVSVYFVLPAEPPLIVTILLGALCLAPLASFQFSWRRPVLVALLAFWAGVIAGQIRTHLVAAPVLPGELNLRTVTGIVEWAERIETARLRLVLKDLEVQGLSPDKTPRKARITLPVSEAGPGTEQLGARITVRARLAPPGGAVVAGGYDFARTSYFKQVGATALVAFQAKQIAPPADRYWQLPSFAELRRLISQRIDEHLPAREAGIATALITGARGGIEPEDLDALRDAGLAHMLAISGLHIGLVSMLILVAVRGGLAFVEPIALRWPLKKIAAAAALVGAGFYLGLSGASISTQRAFIMLSVVLVAVWLNRPAITLRSVALAATIILLWRPESLLSPGFQMSFGAVTCLVAAYEWVRARAPLGPEALPPVIGRAGRYLGGLALTTLVAEFATAPFGLFHFNHGVSYGLLGNELAMPLLAFVVMPAAVASILSMPFGLEAGPLWVLERSIGWLLEAAHWTASLPGAVVYVENWGVPSLVLAVLGGLWLCLWSKPIRLLGLVPIAISLMLTLFQRGPDLIIGPAAHQFAVRSTIEGREHVLLFGTRLGAFRGDVWAGRMGHGSETTVSGLRFANCDATGCQMESTKDTKITFVKDGRALAEDCRQAGVLISKVPVRRPCPGPDLVVDPDRIAEAGYISLFAEEGGRWRTRQSNEKKRPWTPQAK